jgi:hypothetical protein
LLFSKYCHKAEDSVWSAHLPHGKAPPCHGAHPLPTFSLGYGRHGKRWLSSDDIVCN